MGGCLTLDRDEAKARRRSDQIDRQLGELARQERNVLKILLLGVFVIYVLPLFLIIFFISL